MLGCTQTRAEYRAGINWRTQMKLTETQGKYSIKKCN